ncbi:BTAD domain-containing putative transcriptional regulator [Streptomyces sp. MUM 2J]|uniref:AfsR/SARP family transcriptional regulator n=1 Tax=Streptomyces sp. MUM 2J TaxID=2791987 RepID=UPI001F03E30A|nr:BTAD domain-containing putative transcriptional regulator [Streptomyces sp. MUM 2J]MCH0564831.1 tetratricopeptide repeat protein [Streptomyces sp. MUM 2J]
MIEVRLLGPVEVWDDGTRSLPLGGSRPVALLSALVVHLGEVLSTARLVDLVWEDRAPATAGALVASHVAAARRALAPAGAASAILTRAPGYLADLPADRVDARRFERLLSAGRRAADAGCETEALDLLSDALSLWRGQGALEGVTQSFARIEAARLEELRLVAQERLYALRLKMGHDGEVVAPLLSHVAAHPLRERPRAQLMTALFRVGRAPDALRVFQEGRDLLRADLGLDPGPELRALHLAVLRNDPELAAGRPGAAAASEPGAAAASTSGAPGPVPGRASADRQVPAPAGPGIPAPAPPAAPAGPGASTTAGRVLRPPSHLPPDVADFVGRTRQVAWTTALLDRARDAARTAPLIAVISGRPGMGKTALAVHAAHRAAHLFPDGRLFLDLRTSDSTPLTTADALARLLRALGVDPEPVSGTDDLIGLYRTHLADRRILLILDNAPSEARLRPLLPPGPGSAVLITSRRRLTALEGAVRLDLSVPDPGEALHLLSTVAGRTATHPGPGDLAEIVSLCGQLPLALRIAGARLAARPHWGPGQLAGRLRDERRRLNELRVGDLEVRTSLELGYAELDPPERRALRRLALMDLPDFAAWIAAPLLGIGTEEAEEAVERLVDCHLIEVLGIDVTGENRYRIHDLVREHAREHCLTEESPAEREDAVKRLVACWLTLSDRAAARGPGGVSWLMPQPDPECPLDPEVQDRLLSRPTAWFAAEQNCLVSAVHHCATQGMTRAARELAGALIASSAALYNQFDVWAQTHTVALDAVRRQGDGEGEAWLLVGLGQLRYEQDRFEEAYAFMERARRLFDEQTQTTGDAGEPSSRAARDALRGSATALVGIGTIRREQARFGEASEALTAALERYGTLGDDAGLARTQYGIGYVHREQGRGDQAREALTRSLELFRRVGDQQGEALTLRSIALCDRARGALSDATELLVEALRIFTSLGDSFGLMYTEQALAKVELRQGLLDRADERLVRCLEVARERQDRFGEALVLRTRGEWHLAGGDPDAAEAPLREAIALWERLALPLWRARTLRDLAEVHAAHADHPAAEEARRQAHAAFRALGSREAWEERG